MVVGLSMNSAELLQHLYASKPLHGRSHSGNG
jgi:hypothetical protein